MQPKNQTASRISAIHITILIQIPPSATENTGETASPPPSAPGSIQNPGASPGTPHPPSTGGRYTPPGRSPEDFLQNVADALLPDHGSRLRTHQLRLPPGLERQKTLLPQRVQGARLTGIHPFQGVGVTLINHRTPLLLVQEKVKIILGRTEKQRRQPIVDGV